MFLSWRPYLLCLILALLPTTASLAADRAMVYQVSGDARVLRGEQTLPAERRLPLRAGDVLETGVESRLGIRLADGSIVNLGADTRMALQALPNADGSGKARMEMLRGVFRAVTGAIGKRRHPDFVVITPDAAIGVRGTDFWGGYLFDDGLAVLVLDGKGVYVQNVVGEVLLGPGQGTSVRNDATPPNAPDRWSQARIDQAVASIAMPSPDPDGD